MTYEEIKDGLEKVIHDPEQTKKFVSELREKGIILFVTSLTKYNEGDEKPSEPVIEITIGR